MALRLDRGEKLTVKGRTVTVTDTAYAWLPVVRAHLVQVARARQVITYGELREELGLPYLVQGMGRLLDLLSEDCFRRDEPSLASLVVNASTGQVGSQFGGDAAAERELVHARTDWSSP